MSMFKSLQHMPGVITLFHSAKSPLSNSLLAELQRHSMPIEATSDKSASKQENYSIDVCSNFPTKDQFQFILSAVKHNEKLRNPFQIAFPKWGKDLNQLSKSFNGENYDDILSRESGGVAGNSSEVVNKLIESGVYNPPLFVDWDNSLIAVDEKHLNEIIAKHTQT